MKTAEQYYAWENDYFKRYTELFNDAQDEYTFRDGIICFDKYINSSPKIMFINREAYDEDGGYNISEAIRNKKFNHWCNSPIKSRYKEYLPLIDIVNHKTRDEIKAMNDCDIESYVKTFNENQNEDLLLASSYVNIKKSYGNPTSKINDLRTCFLKGEELILEQISTINPNIILGGNIVGALEYSPKIEWGQPLYSKNGIVIVYNIHIQGKAYKFFDICHPSAVSISKCEMSEYYKEIFKAYQTVI